MLDTTSTTVSMSAGARTVADEIPATRTMQEMVSIAPGVMPTAAPDLGGGVIASFVLSRLVKILARFVGCDCRL